MATGNVFCSHQRGLEGTSKRSAPWEEKRRPMIVGVEIVTGGAPSSAVESAAAVVEASCQNRGFPVHRVPEPTNIDNRLCIYLSTSQDGHPLEELLDRGVRRDAFARLSHGQYLVRSWLGKARLHIALAAKSGEGLMAAAKYVSERIESKQDFSHLDMQGPVEVSAGE